MLKSIIVGLAAAITSANPLWAQEQTGNPTGPYLAIALGAEKFQDNGDIDFDEGSSLSGHIGYRFNNNFRAELELALAAADVDNQEDDLAYARYVIGAYYDFQGPDQFFAPYVGGGIGVGYVTLLDDNDDDVSDAEFSFHGEAGVALNFNPYIAVVPSYRFTWIDDADGFTEKNLSSHAARVALRLSF